MAREITAEESIRTAIVDVFGQSILTEQGEIDRAYLGQCVFNEPELKQQLEQILHPVIHERLKTFVVRSKAAVCVLEIPLVSTQGLFHLQNR